MNKLIAIIDDEPSIINALSSALRSLGQTNVMGFTQVDKFIDWFETAQPEIVISDQRMPELNGSDLMEYIYKKQPDTWRIIISGFADFNEVIDGFNKGHIHRFINKPWRREQLIQALEIQSSPQKKISKNKEILISDSMSEVINLIHKFSVNDSNVHIQGASGTGKEWVAQEIHIQSYRNQKAFCAFNCANFQTELLESQLFGHVKGAFTGAINNHKGLLAEAEGGTLFLDEVTELSLSVQAKLLRVIQEREYIVMGENKSRPFDVRIVTASAKPLQSAVSEGAFREDLMYRLDVMPITLPLLKERQKDILPLIHILYRRYQPLHEIPKLSSELIQLLQQYSWPGNIRQLENLCAYWAAIISKDQQEIGTYNLPPQFQHIQGENEDKRKVQRETRSITDNQLLETLSRFDGNRSAVARELGISRMTVWRRLSAMGLENDQAV